MHPQQVELLRQAKAECGELVQEVEAESRHCLEIANLSKVYYDPLNPKAVQSKSDYFLAVNDLNLTLEAG